MNRIRGPVAAALSRGPGYEPQHLGAHLARDRVSGYYLDLRAKAAAPWRPRVNATGVVSKPGPTADAQQVLGWYDLHLDGYSSALDLALAAGRRMLERAQWQSDGLLWPYEAQVPKYRIMPPWFSCMAQGQAASAFVRLHLATGEDVFAETAIASLRPLIARLHGLVTDSADGPILEECPSDPRCHVLNGWVYGLFGLRDVAVALSDRASADLFAESTAALVARLPNYDVGWWSLYSLYPVRRDLAKPFYHAIHVSQLAALHLVTRQPAFSEVADRWRKYDSVQRRMRVVAAIGRQRLRRRGRFGPSG
jgi:heparosan-N-sulfate-glucuronate 5-epimerase